MLGPNFNRLYGDEGYKIRYMRDLQIQIREGYLRFCRLLGKSTNKVFNVADERELVKLFYWLQNDIKIYKKIRGTGIEGVIGGDITDIEKKLIKNNQSYRLRRGLSSPRPRL